MEYSDFEKSVNGQLAKRKKELIELKQLIESTSSEPAQALYRRTVFLLLYAHWEGFIKFLGMQTLQYINSQNLQYKNLHLTFSAISMHNELKGSIPEKEPQKIKLLMKLLSGNYDACFEDKFECKHVETWVDAKSNLNREHLEDILMLFGINLVGLRTAEYVTNNWLDTFLGRRNKIAHGGLDEIDTEIFNEAHTRIIELLDFFNDTFLSYVGSGEFKKNQSSRLVESEL